MPLSNDLSFAALLHRRACLSGDKTAYIFKNKSYTWADVDRASDAVAAELNALGVKKGTHVGLCAVNSVNWIFTFFAIQKSGAVAVLINPGLNACEVEKICRIGGVSHLCYGAIPTVTDFDAYASVCRAGGAIQSVLDIGEDIDFAMHTAPETAFLDELKSDDPCMIIYTSGSTGKPKAVLSSAYGIIKSVTPILDNNRYCGEDINLAFLPLFHVFGFASAVAAALLIDFCSVIPQTKSPAEMIALIDKYRVSIFNTVPTMMLAVVAHPDFSPQKLSSLRLSILGGSATTTAQMTMLKGLLPHNHFGNIYGMSENAAISLTGYDDTSEHITKTVGMPVSGIDVVIKDTNGNLLPHGAVGEICVKSDSMLVCYYKLPIQQQPIDDDGYLRTGDLGYIGSDGYIVLTGRIKDLIICGGENISPSEVADAVMSLGLFADVLVVGVPDAVMGEVVAAAVILKCGCDFDKDKVRASLSASLSKYKCPCHYKLYDTFPLLASGKPDKLLIIKQIADDTDFHCETV